MSKKSVEEMTTIELERLALADSEVAEEAALDPSHPGNFNIAKGMKLPEEFENPPCGEEGHFCLDQGGFYNPTWTQLMIEKIYDKQVDPQVFPLSSRWLIPLDKWVDAPPEVIESLRSAVEIQHRSNVRPGEIILGQEIENTQIERRRFVWRSIQSARLER